MPSMATEQTPEKVLWKKHWSESDSVARSLLIEKFTYIAKKISASLFKNRTDDDIAFEDYFQFGLVGLIEAIDRYRSDKGANFETYATYRVRGAILNGIDKLTEKRDQIAYRKRLRKERLNSLKEGSQESTRDPFEEMVDVAIGLALGYMLEDSCIYEDSTKEIEDTGYKTSELLQLKQLINQAVNHLPDKEQLIIRYHYFENTNFTTIADILSFTKGRVSQLHSQALGLLRKEISKINFDGYF